MLAALFALGASAISLNDSLAVVKNFTNVYIHQNETIFINLEEYFRGNMLSFRAEILDLETGETRVDPTFVNFTNPISSEVFSDFSQTVTQRSLP